MDASKVNLIGNLIEGESEASFRLKVYTVNDIPTSRSDWCFFQQRSCYHIYIAVILVKLRTYIRPFVW